MIFEMIDTTKSSILHGLILWSFYYWDLALQQRPNRYLFILFQVAAKRKSALSTKCQHCGVVFENPEDISDHFKEFHPGEYLS